MTANELMTADGNISISAEILREMLIKAKEVAYHADKGTLGGEQSGRLNIMINQLIENCHK